MDHPFRSAAVGGFNKQDVLTFLEAQAKQAAQTQQDFQTRLEEAEQQRDALRQERDSLSAQLEQRGRELSACQERAEGA